MPRIKIDYIVSFSSEDPDNPASNLLAFDVNKKKWLCSKGEPSCSVVLQLTKAVQICAVHIGAYHAALVEVLVGRSERPNEPFQVLVPSSVFLNPSESRKDVSVDKLRSFNADSLASPAAEGKWDRVRVVCSQPYNKHCKYGLSFIHIHSPEENVAPVVSAPVLTTPAPAPAVPQRLLAIDTFSSDDEELSPGELFKQYLSQKDGTPTNTGAQIRQATSQALKNVADSSVKLNKTPISKENRRNKSPSTDARPTDRQRHDLLYNDDDDKPHAKIDRVVNKYKDDKSKEDAKALSIEKQKQDKHNNSISNKKHDSNGESSQKRDSVKGNEVNLDMSRKKDTPETSRKFSRNQDVHAKTPQSKDKINDNDHTSSSIDKPSTSHNRKRSHSHRNIDSSTILSGVVFVLSGYENPRRSALRDTATSLGAQFKRDWDPSCTHLICAFPNTPKLKGVRASSARAVAVKGEWIEACLAKRRRLPWQWFATEPDKHQPPGDDEDDVASEEDTDDEIERVRQKLKKHRGSPPASPPRATPAPPADVSAASIDSDVTLVRYERIQAEVTISDGESTEEEVVARPREQIDGAATLPAMFDGRSFTLAPDIKARKSLARRLARYVRAYGGEIVEETEDADDVDYIVSESAPRQWSGKHVSPTWVWRCHAERRLCPVDTEHC